tara:strand:- start:1645 stop:2217 length:573 start_codon:yes stop_codon:yes gene_type:complete
MGPAYTGYDPASEDPLTQEERGMVVSTIGANERRLDMMMRDKHYLLQQNANLVHAYQQMMSYFLQLNSLVMGRALPALDLRQQGGGGNPIGDLIGGIIGNMLMGGQGSSQEEAPAPPPPSPQPPGRLAPQPDAYVPYEPSPPMDMGMGAPVGPSDITEDMAQEWAAQNPDAAKRVAKGLLPPAMQKLIPK